MRWLLLLLLATVILPTVCLLWFMTAAVRNERLAIRQRLVDTYVGRARTWLVEEPGDYWDEVAEGVAEMAVDSSWPVPPESQLVQAGWFDGAVIEDEQGQRVYPMAMVDEPPVLAEELTRAQRLEFEEGNVAEALFVYQDAGEFSGDTAAAYQYALGEIRCLRKLGRLTEAMQVCQPWLLEDQEPTNSSAGVVRRVRMRLLQMQLLAATEHEALPRELNLRLTELLVGEEPVWDQVDYGPLGRIPTEFHAFVLSELVTLTRQMDRTTMQDTRLAHRLHRLTVDAERAIDCLLRSVRVADSLDNGAVRPSRRAFVTFGDGDGDYAIVYEEAGHRVMALKSVVSMRRFWNISVIDFDDEMVFCRVLDDTGRLVAGSAPMPSDDGSSPERFWEQDLTGAFAGWRAQLYFRPGVFSGAAARQRMVYGWTAALAIVLMSALTALVARSLLRQARTNRLKNDFIATVSHELKTPLASMRVLTDTLLEGNYEGEQTAQDYLELIGKENQRLSRLIDNFLTFSRMERNKQVFAMEPTEPGTIADAAVAAVTATFEQHDCEFAVHIDDDLPLVEADLDAMVTVLVNLLDNACKYSDDRPRIGLTVTRQGGEVCFGVSDQGRGMTRRTQRRMFERFYQADSRLARTAEGCGLGLSIVKFIVDAHHGTISVDSKPGQGSVFVVRLPIHE